MNVLSLFDGMSCGQIALERLGVHVDNYFASEVDKYAMKITQKHFPDTHQLGDVISLYDWNLPKIDLLLGGSPCQGFSCAGKGLNWDDPRSQLFFWYIHAMKRFQPTWWLFENVASMRNDIRDAISYELGVEPIMIDSALVSAQSRKRYYWTNIPDITQPEDKGILLKDIIESGWVDRDKSYCIDANYFKGGSLKGYLEKSRRQQVFHQSEKRLMVLLSEKDVRKLTPIECERLQTVDDNWTEGVSNTQRYKMLGNGWTVDVIAHILSFVYSQENL